ncbi:MAG TPA: hypothetical protein VLY82_02525 [Nitrososphaerales archaeon]|nr:hypothetical protein [Nitrososphaerales archaeon]
MDQDDIAYRKSVRNMSVFLAVIVIVIFAAIFIPPYLNPASDVFPSSVSFGSGIGFIMHLTVNSTDVGPLSSVLLTGWVNSSSDSGVNINASDSWAVPQGRLWQPPCLNGFPIGIGVMSGHYTIDNYTLGTLLQPATSRAQCLVSGPPQYFLFYPHQSSIAAAVVNGTPYRWSMLMNVSLGQYSLAPNSVSGVPGPQGLPAGVYTAVLADEWGDVLTANFRVS